MIYIIYYYIDLSLLEIDPLYWLIYLKAETDYWKLFFSPYKWSKDSVHQVCLAFFWHKIRKINIGDWLPFINVQMDTAMCIRPNASKTKQLEHEQESQNEMHAYWYNIDTNNQS